MARSTQTDHAIVEAHLSSFLDQAILVVEPGEQEICGVLVSNGYCLELIRTRNKTRHPGSFALPLRRVRKIARTARKLHHRVVGTFHSHPAWSAEPGESDIAGAEDDGALMLILSCPDREAKLWRIHKRKAHPIPLRLLE